MKRACLLGTFLCLSFYYLHGNENPWITIFIHGSVGLRYNLNLKTARRLYRDEIEGTQYEQNVRGIRHKKYLFTLQPMQEKGLRPIAPDCSYPCGPYVFSKLYDKVQRTLQPGAKNTYYTYGWSGLVSFKERRKEARAFYEELRQLVSSLPYKPKIRIVGYSHGATLAFNLACVKKDPDFYIDEMIAIGMPVLHSTDRCLRHDIFKRVYHIYSQCDFIQHLDIFSPCTIISHRRFSSPPAKLTQIELKVHAPFKQTQHFNPPTWARRCVDQSPGHVEFWFFGWAPHGYRDHIWCYPLPYAIFIPYFIESIERYAPRLSHVSLDMHPDEQQTVLRCPCKRFKRYIPFLSTNLMTRLKLYAVKYHPGQPAISQIHTELKQCMRVEEYT